MMTKEPILSKRRLVAKLSKEQRRSAALSKRLSVANSSFQAALACAKAVENFNRNRRYAS